jgi:hypothetical protein
VYSNQSKFQNAISFLLPFQSGLIFYNYTEKKSSKLGSFLVCKGENPMFEDAEMRTQVEKI